MAVDTGSGGNTSTKAKKGVNHNANVNIDSSVLKKLLKNQSSNEDAEQAERNVSTSSLANAALSLLSPILDGLKVNNLDAYVSEQLRGDYIRDRQYIQDVLDRATNAAYDVNRAQAIQDALNAENANYANTKQAIAEMRRNLIGSASSGANVGAANATALQAILGLGQQNTQTTTEGLQNLNTVSKERAAALAKNASDAITTANDATAKMYDAATSAYASDRSYAAQGAAEALGQLGSADITAGSNERMNEATLANNLEVQKLVNKGNLDVAKTPTKTVVKQTIKNK